MTHWKEAEELGVFLPFAPMSSNTLKTQHYTCYISWGGGGVR